MFVAIQHHINDPDNFWKTAESMNIPEGVKFHETRPSVDGTLCNCLWEADSVDTLKTWMESTFGGYSVNEYYEVNASNSVGLPQQAV